MTKTRVDFFRTNGTWYTTEEVEWTGTHKWLNRAFAETLYAHLKTPNGNFRLDDMVAVCLNPPHENQFPIMINTGELPAYLQVDDSRTSDTIEDEAHGYSNSDEIIYGY